jgi:transcriptional regulator with XRE-family HTH domain
MTSQLRLKPLNPEELSDFGAARAKDIAFEAVLDLWHIREAQGLTQKVLAERVGCDETSISRSFRGPANWTFKTFGRLVQGLHGSLRIFVDPIEDTAPDGSNYDAYAELDQGDSVKFFGDFKFDMIRGLNKPKATTSSVVIQNP